MNQNVLLFTFQWTDENKSVNDYIRAWCRRHDVLYQYSDQRLELRIGDRWEPVDAIPQDGQMAVYTEWPLEYKYHDLIAACSHKIPFRDDEVPLRDYYFNLKELNNFAKLSEMMAYSWTPRSDFVVGNFAFVNATPCNRDWIAAHKKDGAWQVFECLDLPELLKNSMDQLMKIIEAAEEPELKMEM